jgi:hypothetical protein
VGFPGCSRSRRVSAQHAIWMMSSEAMQRRKEESFAIVVCVWWVAGLMLYGGEARGVKSLIEVGMLVAFVIVESFKYA